MSAHFFDVPGNPIPAHARAGMLTARDGRRIRYGLFASTGQQPKGTVMVLTGRNECIEKYFETIADLAARGFAVATLDWRGQGLSERLLADGARGHVRRFDDYAADFVQLFEEVVLPECPGPFYVLGHSMGGLIALLAAPGLANRVRRMVLIAPMLGVDRLPAPVRVIRFFTGLLSLIGFGWLYIYGRPKPPTPFPENTLTTDLGRYQRNLRLRGADPRFAMAGPTVSWAHAACAAAAKVQQPGFMARIRMPVLFVLASDDRVVSTRAIERYAGALRAGAMVAIDGARHEILQEADIYRQQFWAAFDAFVPGSDGGS